MMKRFKRNSKEKEILEKNLSSLSKINKEIDISNINELVGATTYGEAIRRVFRVHLVPVDTRWLAPFPLPNKQIRDHAILHNLQVHEFRYEGVNRLIYNSILGVNLFTKAHLRAFRRDRPSSMPYTIIPRFPSSPIGSIVSNLRRQLGEALSNDTLSLHFKFGITTVTSYQGNIQNTSNIPSTIKSILINHNLGTLCFRDRYSSLVTNGDEIRAVLLDLRHTWINIANFDLDEATPSAVFAQ